MARFFSFSGGRKYPFDAAFVIKGMPSLSMICENSGENFPGDRTSSVKNQRCATLRLIASFINASNHFTLSLKTSALRQSQNSLIADPDVSLYKESTVSVRFSQLS